MRFRSIAVTFVSLLAASSLGAQTISSQCPGGTAAQTAMQDACQQAIDLFNYMRPQLGIAIAGGNTTLGQGGALGGLPHFSIGVRANALAGSVPNVQNPVYTGAVQRNPYPTKNTFLGLPQVDAAIGVWGGLPLGVTNVGAVDLLLSASYVPKVNASNVSVAPDSPIQIGYGARVGLLQESLLVPGVGISFMQRGLPKTTITGIANNDSVIVKDLDLKTTSWRLTASKSLILLTLAAGVGQDKYSAGTTISAVVHAPVPVGRQVMNPATVDEKMTRTNYFVDLTMNLIIAKLVAEIGQTTGGSVPTYSTFSTKADASRTYGAVGIRLGF